MSIGNDTADWPTAASATTTALHRSDARAWWRIAPVTRRDVGVLALVWLGLTALYSLVGLAITAWWEDSRFGAADADLSRWFESHRTAGWTRAAHLGSALSNTETKIALVVVMAPLMLWMYRRWRDWAWITLALVLEVSVFGTASEIVRRDRPPIEQLDGAPTNSWPSGHIAASVVFYVGLALVIRRNGRDRAARVAAVIIAVVAPSCVILSRLYLGMHYATDAIGGIVLGITALWVVDEILDRRSQQRHVATD
jgi:undecaprenyl-diphosphatase